MATTSSPPSPQDLGAGLDRFFRISQRGSTVRTELIAGAATWLTMAYILVVNAQILTALPDRDGLTLPFDGVVTATALVAGAMTLAYAFIANYPFAIAAGLGLNAFVAFTLVGVAQLSWPEAMGVIVVEGLLITALVLTGFREAVLNAIPMDLKRAIGIGIGLFIAFIGLDFAGIVVHPEAGAPILTLNPDLTSFQILVFVVGFVITAGMVAARVRGALLLGIIGGTLTTSILNAIHGSPIFPALSEGVPAPGTLPDDVVKGPNFDLLGDFSFNFFNGEVIAVATAIALVVSVMLSDFFDTMGTVIGVGGEAGLLDQQGRLPGIGKVLLIDSVGAAAGGAASASSNTTYIESAAGVAEGGRTGLTSAVVGTLFLLALFLAPWAQTVPRQATGPILVIVGYYMMTLVRDINWNEPQIGIPALLTIIIQPLTFSITNGVGAGFLAYTVIQILLGRGREIHPLMFLASAVFAWYFVEGLNPLA